MTAQAIKEKLHRLIDEADDKQLKGLYVLFEEQMITPGDWWKDETFVAELDERVSHYEQGIDKAYTWEETEALIAERRK